MHIPDGFLAPEVWVPAWGLAGLAWARAARGLPATLDEKQIPRLAMLTALSYALGLIMIPLPGGGSGHFTGVALLSLIFGSRLAFLSYSGVLLLQAIFFGAGGISSLGVNALVIGLVGATLSSGFYGLILKWHCPKKIAVAIATFLSLSVSAALLAFILGAQPLIAHDEMGQPLFFPFGFAVVFPALLLPQLFIAAAESFLTQLLWQWLQKKRWVSP